MALIPPDAGLRMRLQNDATLLQPTAPVQEIPSDLPELRVGQMFTASIQEVLPDNTFKALVAGKQLTLQLPEGAKAGDTLDLVVIDRTPRTVIAQLAEQPAAPSAAGLDKFTTLSPAARMIGNLLLPEGQTPQPAALNRGQPLLPHQPPALAADLAPMLQKAVTQSGLFYESHQAQWVAGKLPLDQILQEPQAQHSAPATLAEHGIPAASPDAEQLATRRMPQTNVERPSLRVETAAMRREEAVATASASQQQGTSVAQTVPDALKPIVQQQLDAVATQRLLWHGEAWPNQPMEWEIVREDERHAEAASEEEMSWRTTLRLDTPRLGHIDAALRLTSAGVALTLTAPEGTSTEDLQNALPLLAASLEAAGIPLLSAQIRHG